MFTIDKLVQPQTITEACQVLTENRSNVVLGGCAFLRLGSQRIGTAIDLTKLKLDYIEDRDDCIEIGAMATLRDIETHPAFNTHFSGAVPKAVANIIGVQFRSIATVGASVYAKYGFSDVLTVLLALDTEVELCKAGRMSLQEFLERPAERDILTRLFIKKNGRKAAYQNLRISASDYPVLTVAASNLAGRWLISVGARPSRAMIAANASEQLSEATCDEGNVDRIASSAAEELSFGTNARGTAEYRKALCRILVKRAVLEVASCK